MRKTSQQKKAYTVPCSSHFRQEIESLLKNRNSSNDNVNIGDLARAVMLLIPDEVIESQPDPGDPDRNDRDIVTVLGGKAKGRTMPRKPRLQLRIPGQADIPTIRKALGLALSLEKGWASLMLDNQRADNAASKIERAEAEMDRLRELLSTLSFKILPSGVRTRAEALYVLGFPPHAMPTESEIKSSYRALAMIFHPDRGERGDASRMGQLNEAMRLLGQKK